MPAAARVNAEVPVVAIFGRIDTTADEIDSVRHIGAQVSTSAGARCLTQVPRPFAAITYRTL
jgi:hypothetical protein